MLMFSVCVCVCVYGIILKILRQSSRRTVAPSSHTHRQQSIWNKNNNEKATQISTRTHTHTPAYQLWCLPAAGPQ